MAPSPVASPNGTAPAPTEMPIVSTLCVRGSILRSVLPLGSTTQTEPSPAAIRLDLKPRSIASTTLFDFGSMTAIEVGPTVTEPEPPPVSATAAPAITATSTSTPAPISKPLATGGCCLGTQGRKLRGQPLDDQLSDRLGRGKVLEPVEAERA